jgi:protein ImuB
MKRAMCVWLPQWNRQRQNVGGRELDLNDREALERLVAWCERFSPSLGVEVLEPPESLLFDVSGLGPLFHGEQALAEQVKREFHGRGWRVRVALADTIGAAWAMAHAAAGPEDISIVPPGRTREALASLDVAALRLSAECLRTFKELGLRRIGQLFALSRASVAARFDSELLRRLDQATGEVAEVVPAHHPLPVARSEWTFEQPTDRHELLQWALGQQIEQVIGQLANRREGVQELQCRLRGQTGHTIDLAVTLFRPSIVPRHLSELVWIRLESVGHKISEPIASLSVEVKATAPLVERQQNLFDDSSPHDDPRQLSLLIDRLGNRLGRGAVLRPKLLPEAQPELAWRYETLLGSVEKRRSVGRAKKSRGRASAAARPANSISRSAAYSAGPGGRLSRPLSLCPRPRPLEVVSVAPYGPPSVLFDSGREHRVRRVWGPERIHTGWWRGASARRDYYRVETAAGRWFWLFRELRGGRWFLHGAFD